MFAKKPPGFYYTVCKYCKAKSFKSLVAHIIDFRYSSLQIVMRFAL